MAIVEKITLVDDYSSKANKIASSTSAMGRAMEKIGGSASKMGSALKSAFDRTHTVKIDEIGSDYVRKKAEGLSKTLSGLNGKPYKIDISYKESATDKLISNLGKLDKGFVNIKNKMKGGFSNAKFKLTGIREAKREAKDLEQMIYSMTGKKHRVKIGLDKSDSGGFMSNLKSGFSKMNPFNWFNKNKGTSGGDGGGGSSNLMKSIVGGNLITGAVTKGLGAVSSMASYTIGAGFNRLTSIESAQARLRGFGFGQKQVKGISNSAMEAVTGTQYSMSDAMTASASAIAAGMKSSELTGYLKEVGNAAAATGSDFNDIASIMNKVKTTGHLQADEMRQLSDRGLPVLSTLAEQAGVSVEEMSKRISKGNVTFEEFRGAVKKASGTAAEEVAKTWGGAKDNFKAALSKLGAGLLGGNDGKEGEQGGLFGLMTPALLKVNKVLNSMVPKFKDAGDAIKNFVTGGVKKAKVAFGKASEVIAPFVEKFKTGFTSIIDKLGEVFTPLKEKFTAAFDTLKEAFSPVVEAFSNLFSDNIGDGFSLLGTAIDIVAGALGVLADVIVALNPVWEALSSFITEIVLPAFENVSSFVVDTVVPAFSDIADMVGGWVTEAFQLIGDAVNAAKGAFDAVKGAVDSAVDAIKKIPAAVGTLATNAWNGIKETATSLWNKVTGKNATGTSYFEGGMTRVNERGEELIQLARGSKIYPSQKTDRIIRNEVKDGQSTERTSAVNAPITINVYGNNKEEDIAKAISREFKRLGVVV